MRQTTGRRRGSWFRKPSAFLLAALLFVGAVFVSPGTVSAAAPDVDKTVEAEANSVNGDVTRTAGKVTPDNIISEDIWKCGYGIRASARDGKQATVTTDDISCRFSDPLSQVLGILATAGDNDSGTTGKVTVTGGSVFTDNPASSIGVYAAASQGGETAVTVNGNVHARSEITLSTQGVYVVAWDGSLVKVQVNGNVVAESGDDETPVPTVRGLTVDAVNAGKAEIRVDGDVTATGDGAGIFCALNDTLDGVQIVVNGTVTGGKYGVYLANYSNQPNPGIGSLTVWKIVGPIGVAKEPGHFEPDEKLAKSVNYIIRADKDVKTEKADGSALAESHGYRVAKEGERIVIRAADGSVPEAAYNNGTEIKTKDANGNFYLDVPRGGGVSLTVKKAASADQGWKFVDHFFAERTEENSAHHGGVFNGTGKPFGKWVYLDASGKMLTGWQKLPDEDGKGHHTYYLDPDSGARANGICAFDIGMDGKEGPVASHIYEFDENGKFIKEITDNPGAWDYWYENGGRLSGVNGPELPDETGEMRFRGKEIYDPGTNGWYWLDEDAGGKKARSKDVYQPYVYQEEKAWGAEEKLKNANACAPLAYQALDAMNNNRGKWVRYDGNGKMIKGWQYGFTNNMGQTGDYFFDDRAGMMAKGTHVIGGVAYTFDEVTGILVK